MKIFLIILSFLVIITLFGKPNKFIERKCSSNRASKILAEKHLKHFYKCFEILSEDDENEEEGDLTLFWDINQDGNPTDYQFNDDDSIKNERVKQCIKQVLFKIKFFKHKNKTLCSVYKFNYKKPKKVIVRDHKRKIITSEEKERRKELRDERKEEIRVEKIKNKQNHNYNENKDNSEENGKNLENKSVENTDNKNKNRRKDKGIISSGEKERRDKIRKEK